MTQPPAIGARASYTLPDDATPAVVQLVGRQEAAIIEQMERVAEIRGELGREISRRKRLEEAIRAALAQYGHADSRAALEEALRGPT